MSSTESPISINLKTASGHTQITLRAENAEEFANMVATSIHTIVDAVTEIELAVRGTVASKPMTVSDIASSFNNNITTTSAGGEEAIQDRWGNTWIYNKAGAPSCPNGVMVLKFGKAQATGKPYKAFYDPASGPRWTGDKIPKDQQAQIIFA